MMKGLKIFAKKLKEDVVKASNFAKGIFKVNKKPEIQWPMFQ